MNQFQRTRWAWQVREFAALILAKAKRPLLLDELYSRVVRRDRFRILRKCALSFMLRRNVDNWFVSVGSYWTYHPDFLWPCDFSNPTDRKNIRLRIRMAWFKKYNLEDQELTLALQALAEGEETLKIRERVRVFAGTQHIFELLSAGVQITTAMKGIHEQSSDTTTAS